MNKASFVYVVGAEDGPKKIGYSANPKQRIQILQIASPIRLTTGYMGRCDTTHARAIEAKAHSILAGRRLSGEWFSVSLSDAVEAVIQAAGALDLPIAAVKNILDPNLLHGAQIRMARGHLRWSVDRLATAAGISPATVKRMESVDGVPTSSATNLDAVFRVLDPLVVFLDGPYTGDGGPGVRLRGK